MSDCYFCGGDHYSPFTGIFSRCIAEEEHDNYIQKRNQGFRSGIDARLNNEGVPTEAHARRGWYCQDGFMAYKDKRKLPADLIESEQRAWLCGYHFAEGQKSESRINPYNNGILHDGDEIAKREAWRCGNDFKNHATPFIVVGCI